MLVASMMFAVAGLALLAARPLHVGSIVALLCAGIALGGDSPFSIAAGHGARDLRGEDRRRLRGRSRRGPRHAGRGDRLAAARDRSGALERRVDRGAGARPHVKRRVASVSRKPRRDAHRARTDIPRGRRVPKPHGRAGPPDPAHPRAPSGRGGHAPGDGSAAVIGGDRCTGCAHSRRASVPASLGVAIHGLGRILRARARCRALRLVDHGLGRRLVGGRRIRHGPRAIEQRVRIPDQGGRGAGAAAARRSLLHLDRDGHRPAGDPLDGRCPRSSW